MKRGEAQKKKLNEYRYIRENIEELENRLAEVDARFTKITQSFESSPQSNEHKDKMAEMVAAKEDLENEINLEVKRSWLKMKEVEETIEELSEEEKRIIRLRYIDGLNWELICVKMCYSWRSIHYKHSDILKKISKA